jgi:hypothetical protein
LVRLLCRDLNLLSPECMADALSLIAFVRNNEDGLLLCIILMQFLQITCTASLNICDYLLFTVCLHAISKIIRININYRDCSSNENVLCVSLSLRCLGTYGCLEILCFKVAEGLHPPFRADQSDEYRIAIRHPDTRIKHCAFWPHRCNTANPRGCYKFLTIARHATVVVAVPSTAHYPSNS